MVEMSTLSEKQKKDCTYSLIPWVNTARRRVGSHLRKHTAWSPFEF